MQWEIWIKKIRWCVMLLIGLVLFYGHNATGLLAEPNPQAWENWKTDFSRTTIKLSDVLSGGPPKDGISSIDRPKFISIAEERKLGEREPVIALEIGGEARAYPLRVLMWHEIVNDKFGTMPVAVTYCPLCNASIVFEAKMDGMALDFGTTGRLRNSDLLMYDRQSESWWQQFTGEAVIGKFSGQKLKMLPSRVESWASFKTRHPGGKVLVPDGNVMRMYGRNPYVNYDSRNAPYPLYTGTLPENINPMARVVVLRRQGKAIAAIALARLREAGKMQMEGFELEWRAGQASALDDANIADGRDVGNLTVSQLENGRQIDAVHDITFAFVVHAFMPELKIVQ